MPDNPEHLERAIRGFNPLMDELCSKRTSISFREYRKLISIATVEESGGQVFHVRYTHPHSVSYQLCRNHADLEWQIRNSYISYLLMFFKRKHPNFPGFDQDILALIRTGVVA
jgi:hypothetical protein